MNMWKFLKSRVGALSLSAGKTASLAVAVGVLGLNVYNYATNTPAAQEARVRSFSEILASGGTLPGDTTMSFSAGNTQFATAEERAAQEGSIFDAGDADVAAFESAMNSFSVRGSALGAGESGLGMGANAAVELGPDGQPLTGRAVGPDGAAVGAAAAQAAAEQAGGTKINKLGEDQGGLKRASIARASGSNLGSGSSGSFGASSSRSAGQGSSTAEAAARLSPSSSYAMTGAMPKGSTLISSNSDFRGAAGGEAEFLASSRGGRSGMGINSQAGESLRDIALASSKVAANANRSANEGVSPFMAKERLSGGITVEGETMNEFQGTANTSFESDLSNRERGLKAAVEEVDTTEQERKSHRSRLIKNMILLVLGTIAAGFAINALVKADAWIGKVIAIVLAAAMLAAIGLYIADCAKYIAKYKETQGWAIAGIVMGVLMVAAIGISFLNWGSQQTEKMASTVAEQTGQGLKEGAKGAGQRLLQGLATGAMTMGVEKGVEAGIESGRALDLGGDGEDAGSSGGK